MADICIVAFAKAHRDQDHPKPRAIKILVRRRCAKTAERFFDDMPGVRQRAMGSPLPPGRAR
ncbi:hypothetical protein [Mesorhizobium sangaii]|uniref:Uncharacterized protein n=1 Tax=Mesorhizobium sangaii TaxID=505389 RepID=A0A841P3K7_9HYPH|nr:hypothetical protein [Mesorhizobium sangaii]MBB6408151.1 hypothetical protein [Mesorhizobium sangaii]